MSAPGHISSSQSSVTVVTCGRKKLLWFTYRWWQLTMTLYSSYIGQNELRWSITRRKKISSDMKRLQRENFQDGQSWGAPQPEDPVPRPLLTAAINLILRREISLSLTRDVGCISHGVRVSLSYMEKGIQQIHCNILSYQMTPPKKPIWTFLFFSNSQ